MIERGGATEHEMVLAFLRAEVDSTRFRTCYAEEMLRRGLNRMTLIDYADLSDARTNQSRSDLLGAVRGYGANKYLFCGFPSAVEWRRVEVQLAEVGTWRYANFPEWRSLSGGSRLVADGARNVHNASPKDNSNIVAVAGRVQKGDRFPELIAVGRPGETVPDLVLLEGHTRATAYLLGGRPENIEVFVGLSPMMNLWKHI